MSTKRIRIKGLPQFRGGGLFGEQRFVNKQAKNDHLYGMDPDIKLKGTLQPTDIENANLEAEKDETVITNLQGEGIPEFYKIGGKPHSQGGTPLNLPANSFFFSQNHKMKLKDPETLKLFGKTPRKGGYTPAELSKKYDINKYREVLTNPTATKLEIDTAERMIKNYNLKLGALALAQESIKGFDKGIPAVAMGYMEENGINPEELVGTIPPDNASMEQFERGGASSNGRRIRITGLPRYQDGSSNSSTNEEPAYFDPSRKDFDKSKVKPGDMIKQPDGTFKPFKGFKTKKYEGPLVKDPNNVLGKYREQYSALHHRFKTDQKLRDAFVAAYHEQLKNAKPSSKHGLTAEHIEAAKKLSPDEIIDNYLLNQKSNIAVNNKLGPLSPEERKKLMDHNPNYANDIAEDLGLPANGIINTLSFQTGFNGLAALKNNDATSSLVKDIHLANTGMDEDPEYGLKSAPDGYRGDNTTTSYSLPQFEEDFDYDEPTVEEEVVSNPSILGERQESPGKFWTQDLISTAGAASDYFMANKQDPWQAKAQFHEATPQFTDFRGAAARLSAQGAGLANAASTFSTPQLQGVLQSNIQRNMVNPLMQLQEAENQHNVGVANQFNQFNTANRNTFAQTQANQDTQLFDKQTIANASFDNAKRAFKWNAINQFNNAWTNRGKTQTMNSMNDNFKTDPTTGYLQFTPDGRRILPTQSNDDRISRAALAYQRNNAGMSYDQALKYAKADAGIMDGSKLAGVDYESLGYPQNE